MQLYCLETAQCFRVFACKMLVDTVWALFNLGLIIHQYWDKRHLSMLSKASWITSFFPSRWWAQTLFQTLFPLSLLSGFFSCFRSEGKSSFCKGWGVFSYFLGVSILEPSFVIKLWNINFFLSITSSASNKCWYACYVSTIIWVKIISNFLCDFFLWPMVYLKIHYLYFKHIRIFYFNSIVVREHITHNFKTFCDLFYVQAYFLP